MFVPMHMPVLILLPNVYHCMLYPIYNSVYQWPKIAASFQWAIMKDLCQYSENVVISLYNPNLFLEYSLVMSVCCFLYEITLKESLLL